MTTQFLSSTANADETELVLGGFRSFSEINVTREAIARLPGVSAVRACPLGPGEMRLVVTYEGLVPLTVHLEELRRSRGRALPAGVTLTVA